MIELTSFDPTIHLDFFTPISTIQNECCQVSKLYDKCTKDIKDTFAEVREHVIKMFDNIGTARASYGSYYSDDYRTYNFGIDIEYKYKFSNNAEINVKYKIMIPQELYEQNTYQVKTEIRSEVTSIMQMSMLSNLSQIYNEHVFKSLFFKLLELQKVERNYQKMFYNMKKEKPKPKVLTPELGVNYCLNIKQRLKSGSPVRYNKLREQEFAETTADRLDLAHSASAYDLTYMDSKTTNNLYFYITKINKNSISLKFPGIVNSGCIVDLLNKLSDFKQFESSHNREGVLAKIDTEYFNILLNSINSTNIKPVDLPLSKEYNLAELNKHNYKYLFYVDEKEISNTEEFIIDSKRKEYNDGKYPEI